MSNLKKRFTKSDFHSYIIIILISYNYVILGLCAIVIKKIKRIQLNILLQKRFSKRVKEIFPKEEDPSNEKHYELSSPDAETKMISNKVNVEYVIPEHDKYIDQNLQFKRLIGACKSGDVDHAQELLVDLMPLIPVGQNEDPLLEAIKVKINK